MTGGTEVRSVHPPGGASKVGSEGTDRPHKYRW